MITKESIKGEEVFAVDELPHQRCNECMFEKFHCEDVPCIASERDDDRYVFFRPTYDLRTLAAYHAQEHPDMQ